MKTTTRGGLLGILAVTLVFAAVCWPAAAMATTWIEDPDAGKDLAGAQNTTGELGDQSVTAIAGDIGGSGDAVDLFRILASGSSLTATEDLLFTDVMLFLFDAEGFAVKSSTVFDASATLTAATTPLTYYYLGIALSGWEPYDSAGNALFDLFTGDPIADLGFLSAWSSNGGETFDPPFSIQLTGPTTGPQVAEPATLIILGGGLVALGAGAWRRRRR